MTRIKICGITNKEDALHAVECGAWALGFIFHRKSPRYISPSKARKIIEALPPFVSPVGVFVNHKEGAIKQIAAFTRITTLQFHGDEDPAFCKRFKEYKIIKAFKVSEEFDFRAVKKFRTDGHLFDTFSADVEGGSGKTFNWNLLKYEQFERPAILSGGLTPENIPDALDAFRPFAVDVASGVESQPGKKDPQKVRAFIRAVASCGDQPE